jgi:hypothetical protein
MNYKPKTISDSELQLMKCISNDESRLVYMELQPSGKYLPYVIKSALLYHDDIAMYKIVPLELA